MSAYATTQPTSGATGLTASLPPNRSAHAASLGVRAASSSVTPATARSASSQLRNDPSTTSRYPMASPPKNRRPSPSPRTSRSSQSRISAAGAAAAALPSAVNCLSIRVLVKVAKYLETEVGMSLSLLTCRATTRVRARRGETSNTCGAVRPDVLTRRPAQNGEGLLI
ncbi:hypothetical protein C2845_PM04G05260 [Panicum miliaceum]|uniref:Uncharacterized protein n=1 Tax=Panicum miliaceum TaxID=4540 RepID=A0A3L6QTW0_PANMI|nr:hypothetical protein C2845_PM04G05260 [Panicum miliaceum]